MYIPFLRSVSCFFSLSAKSSYVVSPLLVGLALVLSLATLSGFSASPVPSTSLYLTHPHSHVYRLQSTWFSSQYSRFRVGPRSVEIRALRHNAFQSLPARGWIICSVQIMRIEKTGRAVSRTLTVHSPASSRWCVCKVQCCSSMLTGCTSGCSGNIQVYQGRYSPPGPRSGPEVQA